MGDVEEIVGPLEALARRCVNAAGPDYALECAIWDVIYSGERQGRFERLTAKGQPYHGRLGPADMDGYVKPLRAFTASLDAAMSLVPEELFEKVATGTGTKRAFAQLIWLRRRRGKWGGGQLFRPASIYVNASTPALALCAAALKARDHLLSSKEGE